MGFAEYVQGLFGFQDQVIVVIGGTGVLGGGLSDGFAAAGGQVVVSGRNETKGLERVAAIEQAGGTAQFIAVDVFEKSSIEQLCQQVIEQYGRVDVLVNCAGEFMVSALSETSIEDFDNCFNVNGRAPFIFSQEFI